MIPNDDCGHGFPGVAHQHVGSRGELVGYCLLRHPEFFSEEIPSSHKRTQRIESAYNKRLCRDALAARTAGGVCDDNGRRGFKGFRRFKGFKRINRSSESFESFESFSSPNLS